jgi:hypothetical protein
VRGEGDAAARRAFCGAVAVICSGALLPGPLYAGAASDTTDHATVAVSCIRAGAWELGFNGSVISREGTVNSTVALFSNRFFTGGEVTLSAGAVAAYTRVSDLDRIDLEALFAAYKRLPGSSAYLYAGAGGGVRQEWVGSFQQAHYPVGADVGLKALVSRRAAVTVTYEYRRILNDPVADFDEHRFVVGISILLRNDRG